MSPPALASPLVGSACFPSCRSLSGQPCQLSCGFLLTLRLRAKAGGRAVLLCGSYRVHARPLPPSALGDLEEEVCKERGPRVLIPAPLFPECTPKYRSRLQRKGPAWRRRGGEQKTEVSCPPSTCTAPPLRLILTFIKTWPFSPRSFRKQEVQGNGARKGTGRQRKP